MRSSLPSRLRRLGAAISFVALAVASGAATPNDAAPPPEQSRAGLLGRSYVAVTQAWYHLDDAAPFESSARGIGFTVNIRTTRWLDLRLEHAQATVDGPLLLELERRETLGAAIFHGAFTGSARGFLKLGGGVVAQEMFNTRKSRAWVAGGGIEFRFGEDFALTPSIDYLDATDLDDREWRIGVAADWRFARHWGVTARAMHAAVSSDTDFQLYSLGLHFVF